MTSAMALGSAKTQEEEAAAGIELTDTVVRAIRTYVPILAGTLISFALKRFGLDLSSFGLEMALTSGLIAAWWSLWAFLERKWPWLGWLNGHPKPAPEEVEEEEEEEPPAVVVENPSITQLTQVIGNLSRVVSDVADLVKQLPEKKTVGWKATVGYEVWPPEIWPAPTQFEFWPGGNWPAGKIWPLPPPPGQAQEPAVPPVPEEEPSTEKPVDDEVLETSTVLEITRDPEAETGYTIQEIAEVDEENEGRAGEWGKDFPNKY